MAETYLHPTLGELYFGDVDDWRADQAAVPFCDKPIEVGLTDGSDGGPSKSALYGYEWIAAHWQNVLIMIQDQAFDFYTPYFDAFDDIPSFDVPEQLWGTEILLSVWVSSKEDLTVSLRFSWQKVDDPHVVTFYVDDGACLTHSVDG